MKTCAIKKRFADLVSLNIEGTALPEDNLELWEMLRQHPSLKAEFIQTRHVHYLLKVGCDPSASEMAFASRSQAAFRTRGLSEKDFLGSVQDRRVEVVRKKKKRKSAYPVLKIAASILVMLGSTVLCKSLFFQDQTRLHEMSASDEAYLAWNFEPEITGLQKNIDLFYGVSAPGTYLVAGSQNVIIKKREKISEMIDRSEKLWPQDSHKNGMPQ